MNRMKGTISLVKIKQSSNSWRLVTLVMQFCVIVLFLNLGVLAKTQDKRILLHSDTDIQTEIVKLRNEFESLKTALFTEVSSLKANMSSENARLQHDMNSENVRLQNEMNSKVARLQNELSNRGSTYVRWGKRSCNTNGTTLIYKGYMAGKNENEKGDGSNSLCLPDDPTWGKYDDANQASWHGYMSGAEFGVDNDVYFGKHAHDEDIPCAVCKVPGTSVMIPARVNCYPGWKMEYTGYLMSGYHTHYSTDYVCVDGDPDFVYHGAADTDGHTMWLVEGICGTLPCPPYVNYRELACVVCSM